MSGVVIDASVLIKLYIDEVGSPAAERAVKTADPLLAPDLLLPETANILWKYVRRGELSAADASQIISDILQMPLRITASQDLIEFGLRIANETNCSTHNSLYIALAVQTGTVLFTADERLIHAMALTKYADNVSLIRAGR